MKKFLIFISFTLVLLSSVLTLHASSLYFTKKEMISSQKIVEGVTWQKYTAISNTDNEGSFEGKQVVNVVTIKPNTVHFVTWTNPGINRTTPTNILTAISQYETANPNMMVVAAINGDYFEINGDYSMINACAIDGKIMKATSEEWFYNIGVNDDGTYKLSTRGETISITDDYYLNIYDFNRVNIVKQIKLDGFNTVSETGTSFIHKAKAQEITDAAAYAINASQMTKYGGTTYYKGLVTAQTDTLSLENETIVTHDLEIARLLDSNPQVEVFKKVSGEWATHETIIGCPSQFLRDGEVLSYEETGDQGEEYIATRQPRTTLGFKDDGTVVFMTIDGRQSSSGMDGVTLRENAKALINEGCSQGFNFDGGGSTTMAVLIDGEIVVTNSPSDGNIRRDSDFLLAAVPKTKMTYNVTQNDNSISGSVAVEALNGFEYLATEMYIDGRATGMSAEEFTIDNLAKGVWHNLSTYVKYQKGKTTVSKPFTSYNFYVSGSMGTSAPAYEGARIERNDNGFRLYLDFDDPDQLITNVLVNYGTTKGIVVKRLNDYYVNVVTTKDQDYDFAISYLYRTSADECITVDVANYAYHYQKEEVIEPDPLVISDVSLEITEDAKGMQTVKLDFTSTPDEYQFVKALIYSNNELVLTMTTKEMQTSGLVIAQDTLQIVFQFECENCEEQTIEHDAINYSYYVPMNCFIPEKASGCNFGVKVLTSLISMAACFIIFKRKRH